MIAHKTFGSTMAIAVSSTRLAYVVVGENKFMLDYAIWDFRYHDRRLLWPGLKQLIEQFKPRSVSIQDTADPECKLGEHAREIIAHLGYQMAKRGINLNVASKSQIRNSHGLPGGATKQQVAEHLALDFPDMARLLPSKRKEWEAEKRNMIVFVAASLTLGVHISES